MFAMHRFARLLAKLAVPGLCCLLASWYTWAGAPSEDRVRMVSNLVLQREGAVAFQSRTVPPEALRMIVRSVTPSTSLSKWRLVVVQENRGRTRLLEAMQEDFRKLGRDDLARAMERWKEAPLLLVFCMPKTVETFGGIPPELIRPQALVELGQGAEALALVARAYGVETHWIAGAVLARQRISDVLHIPEDYGVVSFFAAGYPREEVVQEFPGLEEVCYGESWAAPLK